MSIPLPRPVSWLLGLMLLGGILLSCQQDRSTQPSDSGPFVVRQTWLMDSTRMPDSVSWVHKGTSGTFTLTRSPKDTFRVTDSFPQSIASDTLTTSLWRLGLRTLTAATLVQANGSLVLLGGTRVIDTLAVGFLFAFDSLRALDHARYGSPSDPVRVQISSLQKASAALVLAQVRRIDSLPKGLDSVAVVAQILAQGAAGGSNIATLAKATGLDTTSLKALAQTLLQSGVLKASDSSSLFPPYPVRVKARLSVASPAIAGGPTVAVQGVFAWTKGVRISSPLYAVHTSKGIDSSFQFLLKSLPQAGDTTWSLSGSFSLQAPSTAAPGTDTLVVTLSDDSGRVATASTTFQVAAKDTTSPIPLDSAAPVVKAQTGTRDTVVSWATTAYSLAWSISDDSALGAVTLNDSILTGKDGMFQATVALKVGRDSFRLVAKDLHGRETRSLVVVTRRMDTTAPTIALVNPPRDTSVPNSIDQLEVEISAFDSVGIDSAKINGVKIMSAPYKVAVPLAIGGNVVKALAWDKAGNKSDTLSVTLTRAKSPGDTVPPKILRTAPGEKDTTVGYLTTTATLSYLVTDDSLASVSLDGKALTGSNSLYQANVELAVGPNSFVLLALDKHGNPARDTVKISRQKDTTKPVINPVSPPRDIDVSYQTTELVVSVAVGDTAGIDSVFIGGIHSASTTSPYVAKVPLQVGANTLNIEAFDKFGNRSTAKLVITRAWATDSVPPTITRIVPSKDTTEVGATTASYSLSWKVADDSAVASVTLNGKVLTGTAGTYSSTQPLVDGVNTFALEAKDARGNVRQDTVHLLRLTDPTKPVAVWQGGSKDTSVWAFVPSVLATWKVTDNALKLVTINGAGANQSGDLYSQTVDLAADVTWIRLMALDSSGNTVIDSVKVTRKYDKTPPTAVFQKTKVRLVANAVTADTLVWAISDNLKLKSVKVNDTSLAVSGGTYTLKVNLAVGTHRYVLVAIDSAGNQTFDTATVARTALAPTHSAPAGRYIGTVYDTLSSPGADSIVYSTDLTSWHKVNGPVVVSASKTVYAKALPGEQIVPVSFTVSQVDMVAMGGDDFVGKAFSLFVMSDGSGYAAGSNQGGAFGVSPATTVSTPTPIKVATGITWAAASSNHMSQSLFVMKSDNTLNVAGEGGAALGLGMTATEPTPLTRLYLADVESVSSGGVYTFFRKSDGTVWLAGGIDSTPVAIPGLAHMASITAGTLEIDDYETHGGGVDSIGQAWHWSIRDSIDFSTTPNVRVNYLTGPTVIATGAKKVVIGGGQLLILKNDGTVLAEGENNYGQLGLGTIDSPIPFLSPVLGLSNITSIAAGSQFTLFLRNDGSLFVAGMIMTYSPPATGKTYTTPTEIGKNVSAVWAGTNTFIFRKMDGTLWGAGWNNNGSSDISVGRNLSFSQLR